MKQERYDIGGGGGEDKGFKLPKVEKKYMDLGKW